MNTNGLILLTLMAGFASFGASDNPPRPSTAPASPIDEDNAYDDDNFEDYDYDNESFYGESDEEEKPAAPKPASQPGSRPSSASSAASSSKSISRRPSQSTPEAKSSPEAESAISSPSEVESRSQAVPYPSVAKSDSPSAPEVASTSLLEAESTSLLTSQSTFPSAPEPKPASAREAESPLELLPVLSPEPPRPASSAAAKSPRFSSPTVTAPSPQSPRVKSPKTTPREAESPESISTRAPSPRVSSQSTTAPRTPRAPSPRPSTAPAPLDLPQKEYPIYLDVLSNGIATLINTSAQIDRIRRQFAAFMDKNDNFGFVYYKKEDIAAAIKNNILPKAMKAEQYKYICIALCTIAFCERDAVIKGRIVHRINQIFAELQKLGTRKVPIMPAHRIATILENNEYLSATAALRQVVDPGNHGAVIAKASQAGVYFYKGMYRLFSESRKKNGKISRKEFDDFMERFFEEWKNILAVIGVPRNMGSIRAEEAKSARPFFAGSRSRILNERPPSVF